MRNASRALVLRHLKTHRDVLNKWIAEIESGVPVEDYSAEAIDSSDPEAPRTPEEFYQLLCGELLLVAGGVETVVTVMQAQDL